MQFTATVEVTAHLVDRSKPYPPWLRVIKVAYDYENRMARAVVEKGYEEGKTFIRRYDNKSEFMVRGDPYPECQRSYLSEAMPPPTLPKSLAFSGVEEVPGLGSCEHWVDDQGSNRVHVYVPADGRGGEARWPARLLDEQVLDGESVPLMTYDLKDLAVGPPEPALSSPRDDPSKGLFGIPAPYDWRSCGRNIGGFPYLHIFHHYLRF